MDNRLVEQVVTNDQTRVDTKTVVLVTTTSEEVKEEEILETIQENFENAEKIVGEDNLWIP